MIIDIIIHVTPFGKESIRGGKFGFYKSDNTREYIRFLKSQIREQFYGKPLNCAISSRITFQFPTKNVDDFGKPYTKKPDIDNLEKALYDAGNKILYEDDSLIYSHTVEKIWGEEGKIYMTLSF